MKKVSMTLALILCASLPGCGDDSDGTSDALDAGGDDDTGDDDTGDDDTGDDDTGDDDTGDDDTGDDDTGDDDTGDDDIGDDDDLDAGADDDAGGTGFEIMATAFDDGDPLPEENTCEGKPFGEGVSPELAWNGAPDGTMSYVLIFKDTTLVDAGNTRQGYHWAAYNIPASVSGIPYDMSAGEMPEELMGGSQFRAGPPVEEPWFFGPCPSWNTFCSGAERATDSYSFTLYALPEAEYSAPDMIDGENYAYTLELYFAPMAIGMAELTATSNAAPTEFPFCPVDPDAGVGDAGAGEDAGMGDDAGMDAGMDAGP